ncbi:hypothetical protein EW145_g6027 [Phellinidium pouzarii]|uniref:Uncharacterized protein n=1 Tax=Phellinidium pouzarii TaxID=167371 RepID=A0A4S4KXZ1_9AGAM|nr:hypothetical protein EW145_g6027 [Phellinidium pouzarii]
MSRTQRLNSNITSVILILLLYLGMSQGVLFNVTVDDENGDSISGRKPVYNGSAVYTFVILANTIPFVTTLTNMSFSIDGEEVGNFLYIPSEDTLYEYNVSAYVNTSLVNTQHTFIIQTAIGGNASLILFDYLIYSADNETEVTTEGSSDDSFPGPTPSLAIFPSHSSPAQAAISSGSHKNSGTIVSAVLGGLAAITLPSAYYCSSVGGVAMQ